MREIKFRVYNTAAKCFYPREHFALTMDGDTLQLMDSDKQIFQPNIGVAIVYQQYTGLKDKNGREIYEGDILSGSDNGLAVVEWSPHNPNIVAHYPDPINMGHRARAYEWDFINDEDGCHFEIIGNIYEHPELLTN